MKTYLKHSKPKSFRYTGSILPSSKHLARELVDKSKVDEANTIIQYGVGNGIVAEEINLVRPTNSIFLGIDVNPEFVEVTKNKLEGNKNSYIIEGRAEDVCSIAKETGIESTDCIISTLPMTLFDEKTQEKIINEAYKILNNEGSFTGFYYPFNRFLPNNSKSLGNFEKLLQKNFKDVQYSKTIKNFPPAKVVYGKKE